MTSEIFTKTWPYTAIILAHLIWGINFAVAKITLQEIPLMSLAFFRFFFAFILLIPFLIAERQKISLKRKDLPALIGVGVLMVTFNIAFFYAGLMRTNIISASVLTLAIPVISVILGWLVLKEKIYVVNLAGIILGLLGAILIIGLPFAVLGISSWSSETMFGNFLIILASLSWVIGAILSKRMLATYSTLTVTAIMFLVGVFTFALPAASEYLQDPGWIGKITYLGVFGITYIAIASSVSAYFLFEWGLAKIGVVKADLFQYIEPLIAVTLGVTILGEGLRFSYIIGGILIGLGVYWSTLIKDQHRHHKAHRT